MATGGLKMARKNKVGGGAGAGEKRPRGGEGDGDDAVSVGSSVGGGAKEARK